MRLSREDALNILSAHLETLRNEFDVAEIALFGSVARGDAHPDSDLDILVSYNQTPGLFRFLELKSYLEQMFGRSVDLVTEKALKSQLRERILREAINVH